VVKPAVRALRRQIKLVRQKGKDSSLWVVDLAGSERSGRTGAGATSTRQKEANNINKSLSTLWHCLTIMRSVVAVVVLPCG